MIHFIYGRLNLHVLTPAAEVSERLNEYADRSIKGGREAITPAIRSAVLAEHSRAADLYRDVMGGRI